VAGFLEGGEFNALVSMKVLDQEKKQKNFAAESVPMS